MSLYMVNAYEINKTSFLIFRIFLSEIFGIPQRDTALSILSEEWIKVSAETLFPAIACRSQRARDFFYR